MREQVLAFVRQAITNQKKALMKYNNTYSSSPATNKLFADQLAKSTEILELWEAMLHLILGTPVGTKIKHPVKDYGLSKKELAVLKCLSVGTPNKLIAHELGIVASTAKIHVKSVLKKLGVTNRTKAAIIAREEGLV